MNMFRGELAFLSPFFKCYINYEGFVYPCLESAFHAAKTHDRDWREKIRVTTNPKEIKKLGRECPMRRDWENIKVNVMLELLIYKFKYNPELGEKLKKVDDSLLIEYNEWHDNFWGSCTCNNCFMNGEDGKNILGRLLQIVKRII